MPFEKHVLRFAALAAALVATPALVATSAQAASEPLGVWMNDTGRGAIEIKQCGSKLCGHVVWVKDTSDAEGCGRQIIGDVSNAGSGVWGDGWIYSPEKKKNYNVEITPQSDGTLKVKGFAGISFLSKTMIWTKAPADLPRCSEQQAAASPAPEAAPAPRGSTAEPSAPAAAPAERAAPPVDERDVAETDRKSVDIEGIAGDVFTRKDGKCKVDTPWVKLDFDCKGDDEGR